MCLLHPLFLVFSDNLPPSCNKDSFSLLEKLGADDAECRLLLHQLYFNARLSVGGEPVSLSAFV